VLYHLSHSTSPSFPNFSKNKGKVKFTEPIHSTYGENVFKNDWSSLFRTVTMSIPLYNKCILIKKGMKSEVWIHKKKKKRMAGP
jgi:hypothetical protein